MTYSTVVIDNRCYWHTWRLSGGLSFMMASSMCWLYPWFAAASTAAQGWRIIIVSGFDNRKFFTLFQRHILYGIVCKKSWFRMQLMRMSNPVSMLCRVKMSYTFVRSHFNSLANHVTVQERGIFSNSCRMSSPMGRVALAVRKVSGLVLVWCIFGWKVCRACFRIFVCKAASAL